MHKLVAKCAQSFKPLVALYFLTTELSRKDAAALAGMDRQVFLEQHSYSQSANDAPMVCAPARRCPAYCS